jgi:hypothetical protein
MSKSASHTVPALETIDALLDEVDETASNPKEFRRKVARVKPGSPAYLDMLPELETQLFVLNLKTETAHRALEEYQESLPDEPGEAE